MLRIIENIEAVVRLFGRLAAWTCLALVLLVSVDVLARYLFSAGTIWLQELEWHLVSPIALLGMSYMLLNGEQVRVDIFYDRMPPRGKAAVEVAGAILLCIFALIIIKLSIPFVLQAYRVGESSPNPGGLPHRFILKAFIPLGFTLLALQSACHALKNLALAFGRTD